MNRCSIAFCVAIIFISDVAAANAAARNTFESEGTTIAYKEFGNGPAVVFIHGLTGTQKDFSPLASRFSDAGFRAIVFDVRGHGDSGKPRTSQAYGKKIVRDVRNLLDHLSIDSAHIIGYSMGGDIANKFRELYPERTLSCVVGGAGLGTTIGWASKPHDFNEIADSLEKGTEFVPLLRLPGAISPGVASQEVIAEANAAMTHGNDLNALAALLRTYTELELDRDALATNDIRTLIIVGEKDAEYDSSLDLHAKLGSSQHCILDGLNHYEAWGDDRFRDATLAFVAGIEQTK